MQYKDYKGLFNKNVKKERMPTYWTRFESFTSDMKVMLVCSLIMIFVLLIIKEF